jgi:hypothetical protein
MNTRTSTPGITFAVQKVERAREPLPTCKTHGRFSPIVARPSREFLEEALSNGGRLTVLEAAS